MLCSNNLKKELDNFKIDDINDIIEYCCLLEDQLRVDYKAISKVKTFMESVMLEDDEDQLFVLLRMSHILNNALYKAIDNKNINTLKHKSNTDILNDILEEIKKGKKINL